MRSYLVLKPVRNLIFLVMMKQKQVFLGCEWCGFPVWNYDRFVRHLRFQCLSLIESWKKIALDIGQEIGQEDQPLINSWTEKLTHAWSNKTVRRKVGATVIANCWGLHPGGLTAGTYNLITHYLKRNMISMRTCSSGESSGGVDIEEPQYLPYEIGPRVARHWCRIFRS